MKTDAGKSPTSNNQNAADRPSQNEGLSAAPPSYGIGAVDRMAPNENRTGLPDKLKSGIEQLSGLSMDDVRVHYNSPKPAPLGALAFTQGTQIHVGPGQEKHLPHEAWHVVQQKQGRVRPTEQWSGMEVNNDRKMEDEADTFGKSLQARALNRSPVGESSGNAHETKAQNPQTSVVQCLYKKLQGGVYIDKSQDVLNSSGFKNLNKEAKSWVENRAKDLTHDYTYVTLDSIWTEAESATAYTAEGLPMFKEKTHPHKNNWEHYVNTQISLIKKRLNVMKPQPPYPAYDKNLWADVDKKVNEAITAAKKLDSLSSTTSLEVVQAETATPGIEDKAKKLNEPQSIERRLLTLWNMVHEVEQTGGVRGPLIPKPLIPRWGALNKAGVGTWVDAIFEENSTYPIGSGASGTVTDTPWEKILTHRGANIGENNTIYVRGHLLNDHLGGPSAPYNLVPLTGTPTSTSNNANEAHVAMIEGSVKEAVRRLIWQRENPTRSPSPSEDIASVRYTVAAVPRTSQREAFAYIFAAPNHVAGLIDDEYLEDTDTVEGMHQFLINTSVMTDTDWVGDLKDAVDAVVPLNERGTTDLSTLLKRLRFNAVVWYAEDYFIPASLTYTYVISYASHSFGAQAAGPKTQSGSIPNIIPEHRAAPLVKRKDIPNR